MSQEVVSVKNQPGDQNVTVLLLNQLQEKVQIPRCK